jgi:hypothetical protein
VISLELLMHIKLFSSIMERQTNCPEDKTWGEFSTLGCFCDFQYLCNNKMAKLRVESLLKQLFWFLLIVKCLWIKHLHSFIPSYFWASKIQNVASHEMSTLFENSFTLVEIKALVLVKCMSNQKNENDLN